MKHYLVMLAAAALLLFAGCVPTPSNFNPSADSYGPMPQDWITPVREYAASKLNAGRHQIFVSYYQPVMAKADKQDPLTQAVNGVYYGWKGQFVHDNNGQKDLYDYYMRYGSVIGIQKRWGEADNGPEIMRVLQSKQEYERFQAERQRQILEQQQREQLAAQRRAAAQKAAAQRQQQARAAEAQRKAAQAAAAKAASSGSGGPKIVDFPASSAPKAGKAPAAPRGKVDADGWEILD